MQKFTPPKGLHIRPSTPNDKIFLEKLHREMREELQFIEGDQDFIDEIVAMQFRAQHQGYGAQFPNAMYFIIEKHQEKIGRASIDFGCNEVHLIDIGFLKVARGHGFGKAIIHSLQTCAAQAAVPLSLVVATDNFIAKKFYLSLGFMVKEHTEMHELMCWYPPTMKAIVGA
ncbi:GNAT family N-acetyltransferase [Shewanella sp. 10N.286.45.A1]|uniref:GNAT family N-acetyltransferase n=1 Tax=Shewanella sp. 10N.286.45.A1 TaxID=3229694 RepID=UPI0035511E35